MKQEDKQQLLIKELCTRQPWGVKVQYNNKVYSIDYVSAEYKEVKLDILDNYTVGISDVKPYLRPMSSMTNEEMKKFDDFCVIDEFIIIPGNSEIGHKNQAIIMSDGIDYLNSIHVDYRGLIPMGLAIEVTEENNPYKD